MMEYSKIRVLVVDDELAIRTSLAAYLEDFEFDVSAAETAEEALELMEKESFHVAIIDLRLPGMSGDALILEARQRFPNLRFIIHTGSPAFQVTEAPLVGDVRMEHIFLKPINDMRLLVKAVEELAAGEFDQ
jgi:CheY-like chemotaxis protein